MFGQDIHRYVCLNNKSRVNLPNHVEFGIGISGRAISCNDGVVRLPPAGRHAGRKLRPLSRETCFRDGTRNALQFAWDLFDLCKKRGTILHSQKMPGLQKFYLIKLGPMSTVSNVCLGDKKLLRRPPVMRVPVHKATRPD